MICSSSSRSWRCSAGTCNSSKRSSARWALARASNGLSLPLSVVRARRSGADVAGCSREVDIVFHLAVEVEGVEGVLERGQRGGVRVQADTPLLMERPEAVVELADRQAGPGLSQVVEHLLQVGP